MMKPRFSAKAARETACRANALVSAFVLCASVAARVTGAFAQDALFESRQLTPSGEYTRHIEGPAVDAAGNLYVANFGHDGTIGRLVPSATRSQLFATLPAGSIGNGIRFDGNDRMYVADFNKHNVFAIDRGESLPRVFFHSTKFNQPNDLAVAPDGRFIESFRVDRPGREACLRLSCPKPVPAAPAASAAPASDTPCRR